MAQTTFDAAYTGEKTTLDSAALTYAHTVTAAGSNRFLLVCANIWLGPAPTVTGITYNGTSMTLVASINLGGGSNNASLYIYGLVNPATGTHNVVISVDGNCKIGAVSSSCITVDQTTPVPYYTIQHVGSQDLTVPTNSADLTIDCGIGTTYGASQTENGSVAGARATYSSRKTAGIGNTEMSQSGGSDCAYAVLDIACSTPNSDATARIAPRALLGVGI